MRLKQSAICLFLLLPAVVCAGISDADEIRWSFYQKLHAPKITDKKAYEKDSLRWSRKFLTEPYCVPENIRFVFLPAADENDMDKIRVRYQVEEEVITITVSPCIFHITLEHEGTSNQVGSIDDKKKLVKKVAARLFNGGKELLHVDASNWENRTIGMMDREYKYHRPKSVFGWVNDETDKPNLENSSKDKYPWLYEVYWWVDDEIVGFAFMKRRGILSSKVDGWAPMFNQNWFRLGEEVSQEDIDKAHWEKVRKRTEKRKNQSPNPSE